MEIRDLHYNPAAKAYQAQVCLIHQGRIVSVPARVESQKALHPGLLSEILAHRAQRRISA